MLSGTHNTPSSIEDRTMRLEGMSFRVCMESPGGKNGLEVINNIIFTVYGKYQMDQMVPS